VHGREARVQIAEVAVVDERPVIAPVADNAHQTVGRITEEITDDSARAPVHNPRAHDDGPKARTLRLEHAPLVRHAPGRDPGRIVRRRFIGAGGRCRSEHPDAGGIDQKAAAIPRRQRRKRADD
jgi:hypothetical protein